jgi:heterocyst specific transport system permease protein
MEVHAMGLWSTLSPVPLAWRQLTDQRVRFAVAVLGVTFAVVLVLMQLGFSDALYASAVRLHQHLAADVVLISPQYSYLAISKPFSERRLQQARSHPDVASVTSLSFDLAPWKNPVTGHTRNILVIGVDPSTTPLQLPGLTEQLRRTRLPDTLLSDAASRPEYGIQPAALGAGHRLTAEVARRRIFVEFDLGTSFAVDGNAVTGRSTFLRLFPYRQERLIDIGLVRLHAGSNPERVRVELAALLPSDVEVLTKAGFIAREQAYWRRNTPIGYVFTFGVVMGLVVGAVIVYLVLFVNVAERLPEFATLKAIGFADGALFSVVLQQALILAALGFAPGMLMCCGLYRLTAHATHLPLELTFDTSGLVFVLTLFMCCASGALALRKVRAADPAEVFA